MGRWCPLRAVSCLLQPLRRRPSPPGFCFLSALATADPSSPPLPLGHDASGPQRASPANQQASACSSWGSGFPHAPVVFRCCRCPLPRPRRPLAPPPACPLAPPAVLPPYVPNVPHTPAALVGPTGGSASAPSTIVSPPQPKHPQGLEWPVGNLCLKQTLQHTHCCTCRASSSKCLGNACSLQKLSSPAGRPQWAYLGISGGPSVPQEEEWHRLSWLPFGGANEERKLEAEGWARAWHGSKMDAVYCIAYHGR